MNIAAYVHVVRHLLLTQSLPHLLTNVFTCGFNLHSVSHQLVKALWACPDDALEAAKRVTISSWAYSIRLFSRAAHMHWVPALLSFLLSAPLVSKMGGENMRDITVSRTRSHHCRKYLTSLQINLFHEFSNANSHVAPVLYPHKVLTWQWPMRNADWGPLNGSSGENAQANAWSRA